MKIILIINFKEKDMFDHTKIDFKVEKFPLYHEWMESPDDPDTTISTEISSSIGMGIRRKDTKEPLGIVSDEYFPVQYAEIVNGVEQALSLSGLDLWNSEFITNVYDQGAKLELRAKFPAHV
tara:strand:- start:63 stop:428 length:366 start_codon:yes stop_codon:yes gene_type:complete